jgi:hypothetical protein
MCSERRSSAPAEEEIGRTPEGYSRDPLRVNRKKGACGLTGGPADPAGKPAS